MGVVKIFRRFLGDRRGAVIAAFALMAPVIIGVTGAAMDLSQAYLVRARLGNALDASTLAAAAAFTAEEDITERVEQFFAANYPDEAIGTAFDLDVQVEDDDVVVSAYAEYRTSFLALIGIPEITIYRETTVQRLFGNNIELALVVDLSGSMNSNGKIDDLRVAAASLINTIVYDNQEEYYSKIALVPYGNGVNVGDYAADLRGPVTGPAVNITGATRASPVVITAPNHGFTAGQNVYIQNVVGMTQLNNREYQVGTTTTDTFRLLSTGGSNINGTTYNSYVSGGIVGRVCTTPGCEYYRFTNPSGNSRTHRISSCVTERVGDLAYSDAAPGTGAGEAYVGRQYPPSSSPCLGSEIVPLTADKAALLDAVDDLVAGGSTGGQAGVEWAWYMLAPNFGDIWDDAESAPADYGGEHLYKIVVLMTDGEYNSPYCNGVIARDATSGSGSSSDHINCYATNGNSYAQARRMCDEMKEEGRDIEIYTIGFRVDEYPDGEALMEYCATDAEHFFLADDGDELQEAFDAIAQDVSQIFLSR